ncbi:hypothetical protein LTR85_010187 [Meristemomyces frigidus]|nr:hypothetical protein LTR85_010187 [Meristemomyces frigidus]
MCQPERPSPDDYDSNIQVRAHFAKTPGLTPVPRDHFTRATADLVKREVSGLYRTYGLKRCAHYGLYWAGSKRWTSIQDRDKTLLLVIELNEKDLARWREFDADARRILTKHGLDGVHGVCLRYYQYWRDNTDSDDEAPATTSTDEDEEGDAPETDLMSDWVRRYRDPPNRGAEPVEAPRLRNRVFRSRRSGYSSSRRNPPSPPYQPLVPTASSHTAIALPMLTEEHLDGVPSFPPPASEAGMTWSQFFLDHDNGAGL